MTHSSGRFISLPSVPVLIPVPVLLTLPNPVNNYQPTILQSSPQHLLLPPQLPHHHQAPLRAGLSWLLNDNYWLQFDLLQVLPVVKVGIKPTVILILIIWSTNIPKVSMDSPARTRAPARIRFDHSNSGGLFTFTRWPSLKVLTFTEHHSHHSSFWIQCQQRCP